MTVQTGDGLVSFRVASVVFPGTDDIVVIGAETLREKLHIDVMRSLEAKSSTAHVDVSLAPSSAEQSNSAGTSVGSSPRLLSGPTVTLTGMKTAQVEADLHESRDTFCEFCCHAIRPCSWRLVKMSRPGVKSWLGHCTLLCKLGCGRSRCVR